MSANSLSVPFPIFNDIDGDPLDAGYIYIGTANLDPVTNPISVYFDEALTVPAAQPVQGQVWVRGLAAAEEVVVLLQLLAQVRVEVEALILFQVQEEVVAAQLSVPVEEAEVEAGQLLARVAAVGQGGRQRLQALVVDPAFRGEICLVQPLLYAARVLPAGRSACHPHEDLRLWVHASRNRYSCHCPIPGWHSHQLC